MTDTNVNQLHKSISKTSVSNASSIEEIDELEKQTEIALKLLREKKIKAIEKEKVDFYDSLKKYFINEIDNDETAFTLENIKTFIELGRNSLNENNSKLDSNYEDCEL